MDMPKIPDFATPVNLALLAVLAVGVLIIAKKNFPDLIVDAGAGAVGVIGDAAGGVAIGVGDLVGIPRISDSECQRALRIGDAWGVATYCPAGTTLQTYFNPFDSGNVINSGVSGIGGAITGNSNWTLGGQIYDWLH
ncbi:hypothetical protein [Pseudoduganella sp. UC29_71]|uniref:hypothetical protein n=1 Tax=Pseudoduganella sp. UC29_71 TaxID=3350174 RepID=UPI00366AB943